MARCLGENSATRERYRKADGMSKQLKMAAAAVLVSALAASASPGQSRDSTRAPVAVASAGDAAAVRAAETLRASDAILADVATIRRLGVLRPVASGLKSREAIRSMVLEELAETTTDREFSDSTAMLRFLGLVPESFELQRETVALLTEQVAGFYAPKTH